MKRILLAIFILSICPRQILGDQFSTLSGGSTNCRPTYSGVETDSGCNDPVSYLSITKTIDYSISWPDSYFTHLAVIGNGGCSSKGVLAGI